MHHDRVKHFWFTLALLAIAGVGLVSTAGCGTGVYGERYDKRLTELRNASPFAVMTDDPTDDLAINFRVPRPFLPPPIGTGMCYDRHSAHPDTPNFRIRADRVLPPFLASDPSGFAYMFETKWTDKSDQTQYPIFLYVWQFDKSSSQTHPEKARDFLRVALNDPKADWESASVPTPRGESLNWKKIQLHGQQGFPVSQNGGPDLYKSFPGVFEMWIYDTPTWTIGLGWRTSDKAWDGKFDDTPVKDLPALTAGTIVLPPVTPTNPFLLKKAGGKSAIKPAVK